MAYVTGPAFVLVSQGNGVGAHVCLSLLLSPLLILTVEPCTWHILGTSSMFTEVSLLRWATVIQQVKWVCPSAMGQSVEDPSGPR